ncbi:hypothetical protein DFH09DRAFT_1319019 [Mycena vulgaris]|nr:hypothetical protein DFH09DRAFT_1319019 [Mycena vulgaris]
MSRTVENRSPFIDFVADLTLFSESIKGTSLSFRLGQIIDPQAQEQIPPSTSLASSLRLLTYSHVLLWNAPYSIQQLATDKGSGAYKNLTMGSLGELQGQGKTTFTLAATDKDWFYLGQCVTAGYENPPRSLVVKEGSRRGALSAVARWEKVWDNAGSNQAQDIALWRGVAANDSYVAIGGIFSSNPGHALPNATQTEGIVAIHTDLVILDSVEEVWNDGGSGATQDGSMWTTTGEVTNGFYTLIPVGSHSPPPESESYAFNANAPGVMAVW